MEVSKSETILRRFEKETLDCNHTTRKLWKCDRGEATYAVLAQFDIGSLEAVWIAANIASRPLMIPQSLKAREEGLSQALRWLTNDGRSIELRTCTESKTIQHALDFCKYAATYIDVADFHKMYGRKLVDIDVNEEQKLVRFMPRPEWELKNTFLGVVEGTSSHINKAKQSVSEFTEPERAELIQSIKDASPKVCNNVISLTNVSSATVGRFFKLASDLEFDDYDFVDDAIDMGGFTVGGYRKYFGAFRAWAMATLAAFYGQIQAAPQLAFTAQLIPTQFQLYADFVHTIVVLSGLDLSTVQMISDRISYGCNTKTPDVYLQPLLRTGDDVAWSPSVIQNTSYIRNMLRLMARTSGLKEIADNVIGGRERTMLRTFGQSLSRKGRCAFKLNTTLSWKDQHAEVDLLAYSTSFPTELLIVEGKAFLAVDEINEVDQATEEMIKAQSQIETIVAMLKGMPGDQKKKLFKFVRWDIVTEFFGVVITPDSEPHQEYDHSSIPAISLRTVDHKMRDNHYASARKFWERSRKRPWLDGLQKYSRQHRSIQIGEVKYQIPVVVSPADKSDSKWSPFGNVNSLIS